MNWLGEPALDLADLMRRARCDANWNVAALRLKGLAATFGIVPLKGHSSMTPMVVNPKPAAGDPLGQRGTVGWKLWTATVILQEAFMVRLEVGATE